MSESKEPTHLVSLKTYQKQNNEIFPSQASIEWFVKRNRAELAECGALVVPNGRKMAVVERFDQAVRTIGERRAKGGAS